VGSVRQAICASPDYLKARGIPKAPEQLAAHDCITFSALDALDRWTFSEGRKQKRIRVRSRLVVNTAEAAVDAAIAGLGIARVLSYQAARALTEGALKAILVDSDSGDIPVSILHREGRLAQPKVQAFAAFAANALRKRMQSLAYEPNKRPSR
jgi:DNA-binding transcriptional LysR family regulator